MSLNSVSDAIAAIAAALGGWNVWSLVVMAYVELATIAVLLGGGGA